MLSKTYTQFYVILGHAGKAIACVFLTAIGICDVFTLDDIVFIDLMSISFHWGMPTFLCFW